MSRSIENSTLKVDESLATAGQDINYMATVIAEELDYLKKQLMPLKETWLHSDASLYFQDMMNEWDLAANGLLGPDGILGQIAHTWHVNWGNYTEAEWSNVATWKF
ncbi:WXG100 family type VII secretion target [Actinacidiphila yeochonensis]|uniref:hypothetical protein n=1 Tax=Actinacidiphila yeochonensis TaxID=89050 RepID=UPI000565BBC9|nr:hypothetical protein [Actinacidiphila yeochonensis]